MKVLSSTNVRQSLVVTSLVPFFMFIIDLRYCMQRLVNISNVMYDQSKCERPCIGFVRKVLYDLLVVVVCLELLITVFQPRIETLKCAHNFIDIFNEIKVRQLASLIEIGLINKVPCKLKLVCWFNIVSKGSTLSKWIITFIRCKNWLTKSQNLEFFKRFSKNFRVFYFKNFLSSSCDYNFNLI